MTRKEGAIAIEGIERKGLVLHSNIKARSVLLIPTGVIPGTQTPFLVEAWCLFPEIAMPYALGAFSLTLEAICLQLRAICLQGSLWVRGDLVFQPNIRV